jgi:hypothetical protein
MVVALISLALGSVGACDQSARTGSETNWFGHCNADGDCSVGHCVCGVCSQECDTETSCPGGEPDSCQPSGSSAFMQVCGGATPAPAGVCLHGCGSGHACAPGFDCAGGACVPRLGTESTGLDAGASGDAISSTGQALSMTTFTRPIGDGYPIRFGECLPYSFAVDAAGRASCRILTQSIDDTGCRCDAPGLRKPSESTLGALMAYAHAFESCGVDGAPPCRENCFCELVQESGAGLEKCRQAGDTSSVPAGWCYVDPDAGGGDPGLVEQCPPTSRRLLRMVGSLPDARLFLGCTQVEQATPNASALPPGNVGATCVPENEFSPTFPFFSQDETTIDSGSPRCESGVCLVANFRGRVSCPYGQRAAGAEPGDASKVEPTLGPDERCYLPGASHDAANEITVPVDPQFVGRPPQDTVYCSCRCDGPAGSGPFCQCPDGFACTHLVDERGEGSDQRFAGSYCVKSNLPSSPRTSQVVCDRAERAPRPIGCDDP